MVNAILIWTLLDSFRGRSGLRGWDSFYDYRRGSEEEDQDSSMSYLLDVAKRARKVPLAGWLLAALVFVAVIAYHFWSKSRVLGQRLVVETKLGRLRRRHDAAVKGNDVKLSDVKAAIEDTRKGKERELEVKAKEIRRKSSNLSSLSELANEVFSK